MDWKMLFKIHMCYHNSENIWNKEFFCDKLFYKSLIGDLVNSDKLILLGTETLNLTEEK